MAAYDVVVIGAGPGGYLAAERAGQSGLKTLLIEKQHIGGTCLNEGCIPTKTLLRSAKLLHAARGGKAYGVSCEGAAIDHAAVVERKREVTAGLVAGVKGGLRASRVKTVEAEAFIRGRDAEGFTVEAAGETFKSRYLILATGSRPIIPGIEGLQEALAEGFVLTSTELLEIDRIPSSLCIVGGGVIGLEMATYFAMAGSRVEIVEAAAKIAGSLDAEATAVIQKSCEELGMSFRLNTRAVSFKPGKVTVECDGRQEEIECEKALICIGRAANIEGYGLETLHVPTEKGAIKVDEHCMTGVPGLYAIGDCNGKLMLAHTAYREAEVVVNRMTGKRDEMRYDHIPSVIYTNPEVATVGESKASAEEKGYKVREIKLPMAYSGRFVAESETGEGFVKLVLDEATERVLGITLTGLYASEMILSAEMMIDTELPLEQLKKIVFPHPTVGEVMKEALFHI